MTVMTVSYFLSVLAKFLKNSHTAYIEKTVITVMEGHRSGKMRLPPVNEMALGRN